MVDINAEYVVALVYISAHDESWGYKIDNISIGYNIVTKSGCNVRVFGSLQNVATFTDYDGIDPEIYGGIDNNFYPRPQTGVFGVTFKF